MSRPPRLELCGGLYHVTSRGVRREDIYIDNIDREVWLDTLAQAHDAGNSEIAASRLGKVTGLLPRGIR